MRIIMLIKNKRHQCNNYNYCKYNYDEIQIAEACLC